MALAACALWLAGVEALPAVHESLHERLAPHRHDGDAIVRLSEEVTHVHPDGTIHYASPRPHRQPKSPRDGRPHASDPAQHAGGLAHHAAAIAPAPPPITQPLPVDRRPMWLTVERALDPVTRDPLAATARGPPAFA